jgi:signal transduction histidine kinase
MTQKGYLMNQDVCYTTEEAIHKITEDNKHTTSMFIHELRNPLTLIKGTLQYIEMKHPEAKEYKYWSQLFELIQDMDNLMTDASVLNSITTPNMKNINLLTLIHAVVNNYMPQADNQQKLLSINVSPECESVLSSYCCDSGKIKQVLSNLLKNALEATLPGNYIEVLLSLYSIDSTYMLSISINNNGQPIPEDEIDNIFLPFVTHKMGGTGVGLALAKRIIESHLGSIHVSSSESLTEFTILLPLP